MSRVERIRIDQSELDTALLDRLRGRVFHVTTHRAWPLIRKTESVLPDPPTDSAIKKWKYDSYFRGRSHVSLCDLRTVREKDLKLALDAYFFLDPRHGNPDPVFLILSSTAISKTVTYSEIRDDAIKKKKMLAPFIEAGYPGDLPLMEITNVLIVDIDRPPSDAFVQALLQHQSG